ncbi:hypothetical protein V8E36_006667 [Tilletia maclaganii]
MSALPSSFAPGRPSASSSAPRRPSSHLDSTRTRRAISGSSAGGAGINATSTSRVRSGAVPSSTTAASSTPSAAPTRPSSGLQPKADPAAARLKSNAVGTASPSPTRKVRNPLGPVPALPALPSVPSTLSLSSSTSAPALPTTPAPPVQAGALSGPETDDEMMKTLRANKKRAAPESFDVRAGGSAAAAAVATAVAARSTDPEADAAPNGSARNLPTSVTAEFHIGSSGPTTAAATRTKSSRVSVSSAPSNASAPMDPDELALGAGPLPSRRISTNPSSSGDPAAAALERIAARRAATATAADSASDTDSSSKPGRRDRPSSTEPLREHRLAEVAKSSPIDSGSDSRPLRPALKRVDPAPSSGSSTTPQGPTPARRDTARSESPLVRTPLEPIPELGADAQDILDRRQRRRAEEDQARASAAGSYERHLRDIRPASASPTTSRTSPTPRTTRFAPLPPSHSGEQLRRERASSDADRVGGNGQGSARAPLPLTRSLASFDDLHTSVPLPSHGLVGTLNSTSSVGGAHAHHNGLPLHSTPAPPSRSGGTVPLSSAANGIVTPATAGCAHCGHTPAREEEEGRKHRPPQTADITPPSLTQADLDDAIARVTDVLEERLADIQLDILRSARQSRNAILDELRSYSLPSGGGEDEDAGAELERLREENRRLRALLGEERATL